MSVTQVPLRPVAKGTLPKLWLAIAALIALAYGIAYFGAGQFKTVTVETIAPGKGPFVGEMDGVFIEYTGRTENGTVFDTTEGRGATPFLVMQLFPGFKQALARMQQGGRYKIVVPGRLAYGKNPPTGSPIGVNEDLSFDVYVQQVVPNAALSAGATQPPQ
jgi:FKBP-type peptidyl-prolyl cis-trans isomerase FkpA